MSFRLEGVDRVTTWTHTLSEQMEQDVKRLIQETAYRIEAKAIDNITAQGAVDTGHLRRNIRTVFPMADKGMSAIIGTNVEYALYVEFGTSRMPERPYLVPAYLQYKTIFETELRRIIGGR